jgi:photosystem II stability/assembly factor-like uncharacterized protein
MLMTGIAFQSYAQSEWIVQNNPDTTQETYFSSIFFVNDTLGYLGGSFDYLYKTCDGGKTWKKIFLLRDWMSSFNPYDQYFFNPDTGFVVAEYRMPTMNRIGVVFRTLDGGVHWDYHDFGMYYGSKIPQSIFFVNNQIGWIVGTDLFVKTTDMGANWFSPDENNQLFGQDVFFVNPDTGWVAGGQLLRTVDGGNSWAVQMDETQGDFLSLQFLDSKTGWLVGVGGQIFKTDNGGLSWEHQKTFTNENFHKVRFTDPQNGWIVSDTSIYHTTNAGNSWDISLSDSYSWINDVFFVNPDLGWAVGYNRIFKYDKKTKIDQTTYSTTNGDNNVALGCFPNPFNNTAVIRLALSKSSRVTISIYDLTGRLVDLIVDGNYTIGRHDFRWNRDRLPSGIYLCRAKIDHFFKTIKLIHQK